MPRSRTIAGVAGAGAAAVLALAGGLFLQRSNGDVQICTDAEHCQTITKEQYAALRTRLADKYETREPMTQDEYQLFVSIADKRIKEEGGITLESVTSTEQIRDSIVQLMKDSTP